MPHAALYVAYHKAAPLISGPSIFPIHVGSALATEPLPGMLSDSDGPSISEKNAAYCELTALYWAWKNDRDASHIGLMHYRRMLDFSQPAPAQAVAELFSGSFDVARWTADTEAYLARPDLPDLVVPPRHYMGLNVERNFAKFHNAEEFSHTRAIVEKLSPEMIPAFDRVAQDRILRLGNIMIMSRPLLDRYANWLFAVLEELENADITREYYSAHMNRYAGFMSERLLTVFVDHLQHTAPDITIAEHQILNLSKAATFPTVSKSPDDVLAKDLNAPGAINIAFSSDRAFLPHAAAMIHSVLAHADSERAITFFYLHSRNVSAYDLELLDGVMAPFPNARLFPLSAGDPFAQAHRSATRAPSNATYNRFLLFSMLPGLKRLLYLDCDMILRGDVGEIYDSDLQGKALGAVPDWIMTRTLAGPTRTLDPDVPDLGRYQSEVLGMSPGARAQYFNAGLLLFDFTRLDLKATAEALTQAAQTKRYLFRDQDILNAHFQDNYTPLPGRMNAFNTNLANYGRVPEAAYNAAMEARENPLVIHYAAADFKPWQRRPVPLGQHYWQHLSQTPFVAEVLARMHPAQGLPRVQRWPGLVRAGRSIAERFPATRPFLLYLHARLKKV
ncbi:MAG: DUF4422 domain-containing protein [Pseudomonadota bacterium]